MMAQFPRVTPKMPKRETEALISELKEIARVAKMETANFGGMGGGSDPTDFIRERTRLWRNSWIISPLEALIERYEQALKELEGAKK